MPVNLPQPLFVPGGSRQRPPAEQLLMSLIPKLMGTGIDLASSALQGEQDPSIQQQIIEAELERAQTALRTEFPDLAEESVLLRQAFGSGSTEEMDRALRRTEELKLSAPQRLEELRKARVDMQEAQTQMASFQEARRRLVEAKGGDESDPAIVAFDAAFYAHNANLPVSSISNLTSEINPSEQEKLNDLGFGALLRRMSKGPMTLDELTQEGFDDVALALGIQQAGLGSFMTAFDQDRRTRSRAFQQAAINLSQQNPELAANGVTTRHLEKYLRSGLESLPDSVQERFGPFLMQLEQVRSLGQLNLVTRVLDNNPVTQTLAGMVGTALEEGDTETATAYYNAFRNSAVGLIGDQQLVDSFLPGATITGGTPPGFFRKLTRNIADAFRSKPNEKGPAEYRGGSITLMTSPPARTAITYLTSSNNNPEIALQEALKERAKFVEDLPPEGQRSTEQQELLDIVAQTILILQEINSGSIRFK